MSLPPPSAPPPGGSRPAKRIVGTQTREIVLELDGGAARGWRRRLGGGGESGGRIHLAGADITFDHAASLQLPLTVPAGIVAVAAVHDGRGAPGGGAGRFPILRRDDAGRVLAAEEGVAGWLWTERAGSALPMLGEGAPNLALVFAKPLDPQVVGVHFEPDFVAALAARSPLGAPTVSGMLARVADAPAATAAFAELGVARPLTDREVAPAQRRSLPSDRPARAEAAPADVNRRRTSIPPPGGRP